MCAEGSSPPLGGGRGSGAGQGMLQQFAGALQQSTRARCRRTSLCRDTRRPPHARPLPADWEYADGCRPWDAHAVRNVTRGLTSCLTTAFDLFDEVLLSPHLDDGTRSGHWCAPEGRAAVLRSKTRGPPGRHAMQANSTLRSLPQGATC